MDTYRARRFSPHASIASSVANDRRRRRMNRRQMIGGLVAAAVAAPQIAEADEIGNWVGWWERSKTYTLAIADAMPAGDYNFAPFGAGAAEGVRSGDGARTFAQVMQHIAQAEGFYLG